jgi:hypothetical protein
VVWSSSTGGSVQQANDANSTGTGANTDGLSQYVKQLQ